MTALDMTTLARHPLPPLSRALLRATLVVVQWDLRRRTRQDLRAMPDFMLKDIGLDPSSAASEAAKPFWRA
ncbi:DUF1127 domain-containing protein [bacterium]|nr:DUF1127 domain-containing protein [bacterium]